jgi:saccharopine dehydrogenase (NADP+, L-glutamate forming)
LKHIVIFGAGKSSFFLIEYLVNQLTSNNWKLTVLDADENAARKKIGNAANATGKSIDVEDGAARKKWIQSADIVISLLPPSLHYLIAVDCLAFKKSLLTASYVDEKMKALQDDIENSGVLFLCEMGLDPGIDHMSAMQLIHRLIEKGAEITAFRSHCGGLVAPESDNNPWHYKISWNPRNVVLAGKAGAVFKENNKQRRLEYEELFNTENTVEIPGLGTLCYYPNRDSLSYVDLYALHYAQTFVRTTLRYAEFCSGWKNIIELKLTNEIAVYDTDGMTLKSFFHIFLKEEIKDPQFKKQMIFLGVDDDQTRINKGQCTAADVMQFVLENKLALGPEDKDMIVMLHEIDYILNGQQHSVKSSLVVKGEDNTRTAMAKTVGLPLAIATKLILQEKIKLSGLHIPIVPEIYEPVLSELQQFDIRFHEA